MKKTIWKFELETTDTQSIVMPKGAEILTTQTQNGLPCIWALVDPTEDTEHRIIDTVGTGNPVSFGEWPREYVGTYQLRQNGLVFHVFARKVG